MVRLSLVRLIRVAKTIDKSQENYESSNNDSNFNSRDDYANSNGGGYDSENSKKVTVLEMSQFKTQGVQI